MDPPGFNVRANFLGQLGEFILRGSERMIPSSFIFEFFENDTRNSILPFRRKFTNLNECFFEELSHGISFPSREF